MKTGYSCMLQDGSASNDIDPGVMGLAEIASAAS